MDYVQRHYLSAPMQNMTKVELELIPDPDMFIFFEKSIRGGISYFCNRYSKTNNKYSKSYDPKQEVRYIYLDANNLYDYAIPKFLPTSRFKWIDPKEFDLNKYSSNSLKGCVLEVDLIIQKNYFNYIMIIL